MPKMKGSESKLLDMLLDMGFSDRRPVAVCVQLDTGLLRYKAYDVLSLDDKRIPYGCYFIDKTTLDNVKKVENAAIYSDLGDDGEVHGRIIKVK